MTLADRVAQPSHLLCLTRRSSTARASLRRCSLLDQTAGTTTVSTTRASHPVRASMLAELITAMPARATPANRGVISGPGPSRGAFNILGILLAGYFLLLPEVADSYDTLLRPTKGPLTCTNIGEAHIVSHISQVRAHRPVGKNVQGCVGKNSVQTTLPCSRPAPDDSVEHGKCSFSARFFLGPHGWAYDG